MTRIGSLLRDVVNNHRHQAVLLPRLSDLQPRIQHFRKSSGLSNTHCNHCHTRFTRISDSYTLRLPAQRRSESGARPYSRLGTPTLQSPSQHSKHLPHKVFKPLPIAKQSSSATWTTAIVVALISGAVFYSVAPNSNTTERAHDSETHTESAGKTAVTDNMTGEALPGRPGTLTPDQEEKLKEFWAAVLQVFGALDSNEVNGNGHVEPLRERSDSKLSEKKPKKKRMSLFRSKNKEGDAASTTSTESTPAAGADDKYGQTKEFHEALANLSPETLRATFWSMVKHDHPDGLLLRFLRARKWDVEKALVMMVSTMRWRASDMHVDDDIMWHGELGAVQDAAGSDAAKAKLGKDFLEQLTLGKSFLHGLDKEGRPMCFVRVRLHKQGEQSEESLERYTVFVIESARMILAPPVDTACIVFDMTGFSMANMDYAPVKFMIKCFEANYPESLGVVLVHKAPWIFQGIWKIIKGWLDPVVASKVHFTNESDISDYVPKSQIIKELHGDEDWEYKYVEPVAGENDKMKDTETRDRLLAGREKIVDEYEKATVDWIKGGENVALKTKRNELAIQLRDDYWRLDPYVRARTYYDRIGLINPGGKLQFYPGKTIMPESAVAKTDENTPPSANGGAVHSADDVD